MANLAIPALLGLASYMTRNKQQGTPAANQTDNTQIMGANQDAEDMEAGQAQNAATTAAPAIPTVKPSMQADENQSQAEVNRLMDQNANATGTPVSPTVMAQKNPSFKQAFSQARLNGDKTFTWNGKTYTTEMASTPQNPTVTPGDKAADAEKGKSRGRKPEGPKAPVTTQGAKKKPYMPPEVDNSYPGSVMKKGGKIKAFAKGGSVSSRGDGIAKKGFTKGRMV
jgi:hypothetical protein